MFKAATKYIAKVFKDDVVQYHVTIKGSTWFFNIEHAPWWGGVFEWSDQQSIALEKWLDGPISLEMSY